MPLNTEKIVNWPDVIPFDRQSVPVPGTKRPGQTAHYRNGIWGLLDENIPNRLLTLDQVFEDGLSVGRERQMLGYRPVISTNPLKFANRYEWLTWGEVDDRRKYVGSALHSMFRRGEVGGGEYETVGIWSANRPEWQILEIAMQTYNKVSVSLYDTLGKDAVEYIINHAHTTIVFSTSDHISTLLKLAPQIACLKLIVVIDTIPVESAKLFAEWGQSVGIRVQELHEFEAYGKANLIEPIKPTPDTITSICYTSGTTGNPKGVVLRHKSLAMATCSNLHGLELPDDGILMSYLPLAHIYERICELCTIAVGGRIGYFTGDPLRLLEDAQLLKPNFFPSVPRVLNRIYQAAMSGGNVPGLKGKIFKKALDTKLEKLRTTGENTHPLWDRLVFRKIQKVLGGQLQLVTTGSAPISSEVMDFLKITFACEVNEGLFVGYGLTETAAACTKTWPGDNTASGTVGPPQPVNEVKLVDVPAMGYTSEDKPNPRGELCFRGLNIFTEYYKDPKNTQEGIDQEGWFHTGDVGEIDPAGRVKIIDRVKNIMKLAQGEYVALEKIENLYSSNSAIAQIYVHGDSLQSYLLAVIVPDPVYLAGIASRILGKKIGPEDQAGLTEAIKDSRVNAHILDVLSEDGRKYGLNGIEMIKRIHLSLVPFSVENGALTPTFKIKRKDAANLYRAELDALYALGEPRHGNNGNKL
ncbi:long-chain-fatty-acid-CoA ligase [Macrolepiota fuliginosa MF-IS2]|uniref:Long-chain-fatty-acid-CoA ligase n=1 Tax=Macrolepiota fuliginosa MF-IS2 TaxID=1400762 RepID=A0A9P5XMU2_9AGAR|nr:long-chain-fatty-acid-CoA ligase [Macrolepiota fuliginosa MF-IS2]